MRHCELHQAHRLGEGKRLRIWPLISPCLDELHLVQLDLLYTLPVCECENDAVRRWLCKLHLLDRSSNRLRGSRSLHRHTCEKYFQCGLDRLRAHWAWIECWVFVLPTKNCPARPTHAYVSTGDHRHFCVANETYAASHLLHDESLNLLKQTAILTDHTRKLRC